MRRKEDGSQKERGRDTNQMPGNYSVNQRASSVWVWCIHFVAVVEILRSESWHR